MNMVRIGARKIGQFFFQPILNSYQSYRYFLSFFFSANAFEGLLNKVSTTLRKLWERIKEAIKEGLRRFGISFLFYSTFFCKYKQWKLPYLLKI